MIKVHITPDYLDRADNADGGIRRVSEAMIEHLPAFGVEHVRAAAQADVIVSHGEMNVSYGTKPIINVNHGLYWSRYKWGGVYEQVNENVVDAMCRAVAHTAPSEWVSRAIRRGGFFYPEVVYHGVNPQRFKVPEAHSGYVLWNKARADHVSDPNDLLHVADLMPGIQFQTTIGRNTQNIHVLGRSPYPEMLEIVARAGVYLCTARETFGIGTLEAMASGVPVAGWNWGGQAEIIIQGETGYLAPPGDYKALAECIELCFEHRERLSSNCRKDVENRWTWTPRIEQYAKLIKRIHRLYNEKQRPKVSIVLTAYKLDQYLPKALQSVMDQTFEDYECLVVDDAQLESTRVIVQDFARRNPRVKYCPTPENLGLAGARNYGTSISEGRYIRHLDADDFLAENALALEAQALDSDGSVHIVYGHLESVNEDGSRILEGGFPVRSGWPPEKFNWIEQMAHLNNIPSCVMARREVFERSGGYRRRMWRNEDAEFWCRVTSLGFRARKFTQAVTYYHRQRNDSKGAQEWHQHGGEPDWTSWFPWRVGGTNHQEGARILRRRAGKHPMPYIVPFGAQGRPEFIPERDRYPFWYVHDYAYPVVSIIVTCGPGHEKYLIDALDSIQAQSYPDWECVVVNDTGREWPADIMGAPWAKVVNMNGNQGAAAARNAGFEHVRGKFVIWMDADDYWLPWFLEVMVSFGERNDGIIYSDILLQEDENTFKVYRYADFDPVKEVSGMMYAGTSILIPKPIADKIFEVQGGWDTQIPGMEDWDFQIAMHEKGFCAYHIPEPLFVYRVFTTTKRESDYAKIDKIRAYMDDKWARYRTGGEIMSCGCDGIKIVRTKPVSTMSSSGNFAVAEHNEGEVPTQMVQVEYVGPVEENFTIRSRHKPGMIYRFGNNEYHREKTVLFEDAQFLIAMMDGAGRPLYRIVSAHAIVESRDPGAFLGQPVTA